MATKQVSFTSSKEHGENRKVRNILHLLFMLLKQEEEGIDYYAASLGCRVPTVKKYIDEIRKTIDEKSHTGFFVDYDKGKKHYKLYSPVKFLALEREEMKLLYEAVRYLSDEVSNPFKNLKTIENKIYKTLEKEITGNLAPSVIVSGPKIKRNLSVSLAMIKKAINERNKLLLTYKPTHHKETVSREIVPFTLLVYDYEWYIRAFCFKDRIIKTFSINQIIRMERKELTEREERLLPENPDLMPAHMWDWGDGGKVEVKIKFTGPVAERMKKKLSYRTEHPTQKVKGFGKDVIVSFEVKDPFNMIGWILQFGYGVEVLEPGSLRERIKEELNSMKDLYS